MKYYAGLDVSVKETSVCIVDEKGKICRKKRWSATRTILFHFRAILNGILKGRP